MNDVVATLGINNLSKSQVSTMAKELDDMVADFRARPLDSGPYYYLSCDALTMKVREGGRVVKTSVLIATGVNKDGYRELLGMQVATSESVESWTGFFQDLKSPWSWRRLPRHQRCAPRNPRCCWPSTTYSQLATLPHTLC